MSDCNTRGHERGKSLPLDNLFRFHVCRAIIATQPHRTKGRLITHQKAMSIFVVSQGGISQVWALVGLLALLFAIAGGIWVALKAVDARVKSEIDKEETINRLSLLVRPDMIFDEHGAVLSDRGASALMKAKGIHFTLNAQGVPSIIRIEFIKHLSCAPLLTPLAEELVSFFPTAGEGFDWIYTAKYTMLRTDPEFHRRYRLEIL